MFIDDVDTKDCPTHYDTLSEDVGSQHYLKNPFKKKIEKQSILLKIIRTIRINFKRV